MSKETRASQFKRADARVCTDLLTPNMVMAIVPRKQWRGDFPRWNRRYGYSHCTTRAIVVGSTFTDLQGLPRACNWIMRSSLASHDHGSCGNMDFGRCRASSSELSYLRIIGLPRVAEDFQTGHIRKDASNHLLLNSAEGEYCYLYNVYI